VLMRDRQREKMTTSFRRVDWRKPPTDLLLLGRTGQRWIHIRAGPARISQKLDGGRMRNEPQQTPSKQSADPNKEMGPGTLI
ncbi:unnamed protein product, partial [Tetraodon nigroviridis]